jgi:hypothetical protein
VWSADDDHPSVEGSARASQDPTATNTNRWIPRVYSRRSSSSPSSRSRDASVTLCARSRRGRAGAARSANGSHPTTNGSHPTTGGSLATRPDRTLARTTVRSVAPRARRAAERLTGGRGDPPFGGDRRRAGGLGQVSLLRLVRIGGLPAALVAAVSRLAMAASRPRSAASRRFVAACRSASSCARRRCSASSAA